MSMPIVVTFFHCTFAAVLLVDFLMANLLSLRLTHSILQHTWCDCAKGIGLLISI